MGTVRLGNHELLIRIAAGGAANVFLVRDMEHENRLLALKILLPSLAQNDDFLNMFFTEAKIASHLQHENIVTIAGFGQVDGIHCLAMEYVFGASLSQVLRASARAKKPLTVGVLLRLTASVCDALHYAHELEDETGQSMGLVHRDVTPQNILIGFNGVPKLTDFGIAKATNRGWETQAGIVKGKFSYMSPEQALGRTVDRRSDIFGTGIVLWEALTGRDLFKGATPMEVLSAIREHKIEPPSQVVPGLTPIVDPIVMKALRRSPRQRYATAAEMRDDIEELIERAGVQIDAETISKEFAQIYGDEIGRRALALKQAILGAADLEELAEALGGTVLNPKQLPAIQGGVNDPDPLGLFNSQPSEVISDEVSGAMPARIEQSFSGPPEPPAVDSDDFEIIDDEEHDDEDEGLVDLHTDDYEAADDDAPAVPANRLVTGWDDSTSTNIPEDELLSMISEEDATIGFLPPQFAERFGESLKDALEAREGFDVDDQTAAVPDAELSRLRAISSDESLADFQPAMFRPLADAIAASDAESDQHRPVPRAPSVLMEEEQARLQDRFEPRAPSWDMESVPGVPTNDIPLPSRPPPSNPPPPPARQKSILEGSAVVIRNEYPAAAAPPPVDVGIGFGEVEHLSVDPQNSTTDRAEAPLPFGAYTFTRDTKKAWGNDNREAEANRAEPPAPVGVGNGVGPESALRNGPPPLTRSRPPSPPRNGPVPMSSHHASIDWAEPSPQQGPTSSLFIDMGSEPFKPAPPLAPLSKTTADPVGPRTMNPSRATDGPAVAPMRSQSQPNPSVEISMTMLLVIGAILLVAGAALGAFLGPQL